MLLVEHITAPRYWLAVASRDHVERGVAGGFCQVCHGKAGPLRRMSPGDWIVYYSPRTSFEGATPLRAFTAIGRLRGDTIEQVTVAPDFRPFRRCVDFLPCHPATMAELAPRLSFSAGGRNWGLAIRRGCLELDRADFATVAAAMGVALLP